MKNAVAVISEAYLKKDIPAFKVGDVVKLSLKVVEGDKTRLQAFEGTVIRRRGTGVSASFTVLKLSKGSSDTVEKTFPLHSPIIDKIKVVKCTKVRRAKLYYMRAKKA
jgi:large subunit ribosomal protein L19